VLEDGHVPKSDAGVLRCSSSSHGGVGGYWNWRIDKGDLKRYSITQGSTVAVRKGGNYLLFVRLPGVSASNNGYADLIVNGQNIAQAWGGDANGFHRMLYFNEVLQLADNATIQVQPSLLCNPSR